MSRSFRSLRELAAAPLLLALAFLSVAAATAAGEVKIFITNDVHGYAESDSRRGRIGYALLKGRIDECRKQGYETLLLDAGDAFTGNVLAQFDSGKSIAAVIGGLGYRVLTPGNHEFDYNQPEKNPLYYSDVLLRTIRDNSKGGDAPVATCVNLKRDGKPFPGVQAEPVVVLDRDGFRIVVAGVITPYVNSISNKNGIVGFDFGLKTANGKPDHAATKKNIVDLVAQAVAEYNRPGDIVVLLSHVGYEEGADNYADGQLSGRDFASVPNIDFIADAHSHNRYNPEWIDGVFYANSGRYLDAFLEITVGYDNGAVLKRLELKTYAELGDIAPDADTTTMVEAAREKIAADDVLFENPDAELFSDRGVNEENKAIGRLWCRAMNEAAGADLSIYNSGGIRSGLVAGPATVGDIYDIAPFQNDLLTYAMTGKQLRDFFAAIPAPGSDGFPQFYGVGVYAWVDASGSRPLLRVAGILDPNGEPVSDDKSYTVAVNSYIASGGDKYDFSPYGEGVNLGDLHNAVIRAFRDMREPKLDELRENNSLLVFPDEEAARKAWKAATEGKEKAEERKAA